MVTHWTPEQIAGARDIAEKGIAAGVHIKTYTTLLSLFDQIESQWADLDTLRTQLERLEERVAAMDALDDQERTAWDLNTLAIRLRLAIERTSHYFADSQADGTIAETWVIPAPARQELVDIYNELQCWGFDDRDRGGIIHRVRELEQRSVAHVADALEIAQNERDTAQLRAKNEQRKAGKLRSWATHEIRFANQRVGWLRAERDRMQAERDFAMDALRSIRSSEDRNAAELAVFALDRIQSGAVAYRVSTRADEQDAVRIKEGAE